MNKEYMCVQEFQRVFNHPVADKPTSLTTSRGKVRYTFLLEEINEFLEAVNNQDLVEQADAMIDTIYVALGTLVEMGVEPDDLFQIVHQANMSKLFPDGLPHYNEIGKVIKPEGWRDPHPQLEQAIKRMTLTHK